MKLIVKKFGGTSLGSLKRIKKIVKLIIKFKKLNNKIIVIVSAMAGITDRLINLYNKTKYKKKSYLHDIIVSTGEKISSSILCALLKVKNIKSQVLLSWQIPILTKGEYGNSKICKINKKYIYKKLLCNDVLVIPGFQGINKKGKLTTLGRGGSDSTAIEFSNRLDSSACYMYKDVKGIRTIDPKIYHKSKIINRINCFELLEMVSSGSKILQIDSVLNCISFKTKTYILYSFEKKMNFKKKITKIIFKKKGVGIINSIQISKCYLFTCFNCNNEKILKIIYYVKKKDIFLEHFNFTNDKKLLFSIDESFFKKIYLFLKSIKISFFFKKNIINLSLIGLGLKKHKLNFLKIIKLFFKNKIKTYLVSTSEIKISLLIKNKNKIKVIKLLKKNYKL